MSRPLAPLPIDDALPALLDALRTRRRALLQAPPGAGKTTRVPRALIDAGLLPAEHPQVVMLQPRRIAARMAAARIADELDEPVGGTAGYHIRFERRAGPRTRILVVTEGLLLAMLQQDPFLQGVGAVLLDEFHERSLHADLALALCRQVQEEARPDLMLGVMSATLQADPLAAWLDAPVVASEGRRFPVEIRWLDRPPGDASEVDLAVQGVRRMLQETDTDLLVFLSGAGEIDRCQRALGDLPAAGIDVHPLHGRLDAATQDRAVRRGPRRRVVLATNVAETSLTLDGIGAVVDGGSMRQLEHDPTLGMDRLVKRPIPLDAADQRAGRAGRQGPGVCLRLWTRASEHQRAASAEPDIRRLDLAGPALQLLCWGATHPADFPLYESPPAARWELALQTLERLDLRRPATGVTERGRAVARLPLAPRLGVLLHEGHRAGVLSEAALACALLSERDPVRGEVFRRDDRGHRSVSDLWDRVAAARGLPSRFGAQDLLPAVVAQARQSARSLEEQATRVWGRPARPTAPDPEHALLRATLHAWLDRLALPRPQDPDRWVLADGMGAVPGPRSAVRESGPVVCLAFETAASQGGRTGPDLAWTLAAAVEPAWIPDHLRGERDEVSWDSARGRLDAWRVQTIAGVPWKRHRIAVPASPAAAALLARVAAAAPEKALGLDDPDTARLAHRLRVAARNMPEEGFPDPAALHDRWEALCMGCATLQEVRASQPVQGLYHSLSHHQRQLLDQEVPAAIEVPSGSRIRLDYSDPDQPVLAVRIQEVFGWLDTPTLCRGALPITLHLLAPNQRPQQVTRDLRSFWQTTYQEVRRELRQRYPKHAWPEDPMQAKPIRGTARRPDRPPGGG
jgi:ATP-dependent helicase HrpB